MKLTAENYNDKTRPGIKAGACVAIDGSIFNFWTSRRREPVEVKAGDRFCRQRRDKVVETASVMDLRPDPVGIPHVHFRLTFEEPAIGRVEGGKRVLALNSFVEAYHQRLV